MPRFYAPPLLAAVLMMSAGSAALVAMPTAALAQDDWAPSFDSFYDRLAPYGRWFETDRWGYVWKPEDVGPDFRPYYDGHWVYTERYGWYWESDEDWGDIVYHYGRWAYDPDEGWLWVPGYVWGPAWVIWRQGDGVTGWLPMPPDDAFYSGDEPYREDWGDEANDYYGYGNWYGPAFAPTFFSLWVFVPEDHFDDRDFRRYVHHRRDRDEDFGDRDRRDRDARDGGNADFFRRTHDSTRYGTQGGFVVNRGIDPDRVFARTGRRIAPVRLRDIARPDAPPPVQIDRGRDIRQRQLRERPNLMPRWLREGGRPAMAPANPPRRPQTGPSPQFERPPPNRDDRGFAPRGPQAPVEPRADFRKRNAPPAITAPEAPPPVRQFERQPKAPPAPQFERERSVTPPPPAVRSITPPPPPRAMERRAPPPAVRAITPPPPPPRAVERAAPPPREQPHAEPRGEDHPRDRRPPEQR